jgi:hypothetical protein
MFGKKQHRQGCGCPECKAFKRRRQNAAREWFDRTNQAWPGDLNDALELMRLVRSGSRDWMTTEGRELLAKLERNNPVLLRDLYADALD